MRVVIRLGLLLSSLLVATVSGASNSEATGSSGVSTLASVVAGLIGLVFANQLALLCATIVAAAAFVYFEPQDTMTLPRSVMWPYPGAHGRRMTIADRHMAAAMVYAAGGEHIHAVRCFIRAAERGREHARALKDQGEFRDAANGFSKAAAMYAAADEQEKKNVMSALDAFKVTGELEQVSFVDLIADYAEVGHYKERYAMHSAAAQWYETAAAKYAASGHALQEHAMKRAAAEQHVMSAECGMVCCNSGSAAYAYSFAADRFTDVGELGLARRMKAVAAEQYCAYAEDQLACGDHASVAYSFGYAARNYGATGQAIKARAMSEAAAAHFEAEAALQEAKNNKRDAISYYCEAAAAYEKIEQYGKGQSMNDAATRLESEL